MIDGLQMPPEGVSHSRRRVVSFVLRNEPAHNRPLVQPRRLRAKKSFGKRAGEGSKHELKRGFGVCVTPPAGRPQHARPGATAPRVCTPDAPPVKPASGNRPEHNSRHATTCRPSVAERRRRSHSERSYANAPQKEILFTDDEDRPLPASSTAEG